MGKEYDETNELVFKGEYLNGDRWNGEGIEYNVNGYIEFQGEYLNGKRWNGTETEYDWEDGEILSEEILLNGIKVEN